MIWPEFLLEETRGQSGEELGPKKKTLEKA